VITQVPIPKDEFEKLCQKSTNILYRAHKLTLKKKQEGQSSQSSIAYVVYLLITPFSVIVVKEAGVQRQ